MEGGSPSATYRMGGGEEWGEECNVYVFIPVQMYYQTPLCNVIEMDKQMGRSRGWGSRRGVEGVEPRKGEWAGLGKEWREECKIPVQMDHQRPLCNVIKMEKQMGIGAGGGVAVGELGG